MLGVFFFFLAAWHVGSWFPDLGPNPCPLHWKVILNHWTTREVPITPFNVQNTEPATPRSTLLMTVMTYFVALIEKNRYGFEDP